MSGRYSHVFCLAYTIESDDIEGGDLEQMQHATAIARRLGELVANNELLEAVGLPTDTCDKVEDNAL